MSPMMLEAMAREIMQPLPPAATLQTLAAEALELMRREDEEFLPVVAPDTGKFLGVVLRKALELGCTGAGHNATECQVVNHLKADVDFCFADEPFEPHLNDTPGSGELRGGLQQKRARTRLRLPIIVVDEHRVPVGMIERSAA